MQNLYKLAEERVNSSEALIPHADFILADWDEGDDHWQWVIDSSDNEIVDWAESCQD